MNFVFLHPEFFFWMVLPVLALFYFWQTQRPFEIHWLSERVIEQIRAKEMTISLKGRNWLFLMAALLLITAMAQPVTVRDNPVGESKFNVIVAIDRGTEDRQTFEQTKRIAIDTISALKGNNIGLIVYDHKVYRVAPLSTQFFLLTSLVQNLEYEERLASDRSKLLQTLETSGRMENIDAVLMISALKHAEVLHETPRMTAVIADSADIEPMLHRIDELAEQHRLRMHIPFFYYPLGLAMLLILIALSSMSKRRSVSLAMIGVIAVLPNTPVHAGILDFMDLKEAKACYERGEYRQSEKLYARYQSHHDSPQIRYNRANTLFKQGRLKEARYWYGQVHTTDPVLLERTKYNLGIILRRLGENRQKRVPINAQKDVSAVVEKKESSGKFLVQPAEKTRLFKFL